MVWFLSAAVIGYRPHLILVIRPTVYPYRLYCVQYFRNSLIHQLPSQQRQSLQQAMFEEGRLTPRSHRSHGLASTAISEDSPCGFWPPVAVRPTQPPPRQQHQPISNDVQVRSWLWCRDGSRKNMGPRPRMDQVIKVKVYRHIGI